MIHAPKIGQKELDNLQKGIQQARYIIRQVQNQDWGSLNATKEIEKIFQGNCSSKVFN